MPWTAARTSPDPGIASCLILDSAGWVHLTGKLKWKKKSQLKVGKLSNKKCSCSLDQSLVD